MTHPLLNAGPSGLDDRVLAALRDGGPRTAAALAAALCPGDPDPVGRRLTVMAGLCRAGLATREPSPLPPAAEMTARAKSPPPNLWRLTDAGATRAAALPKAGTGVTP
jgi:hypothetical protein